MTSPLPRFDTAKLNVFDGLGQDSRFAEEVQRTLSELEHQGPREVIEQYLSANGRATL